jgi:hypothetical protein
MYRQLMRSYAYKSLIIDKLHHLKIRYIKN